MSQPTNASSTFPMTGGGYTCANCGTWVGYGSTHNCLGTTALPVRYITNWNQPCDHCLCEEPSNAHDVPHKRCCHCYLDYAVTKSGKRKA